MDFTDLRKKVLPILLVLLVCAALTAGGILMARSASSEAATVSQVKGVDGAVFYEGHPPFAA